MKDLVLVIDVQNAYMKGQPWECNNTDGMLGNIRSIIDSGKSDVVFTQFLAPSDPVGTWCDYNTINKEINESEELNEIEASLKPYLDKFPVIQKSTYSCMKSPELCAIVKKYDRLVLTGVVAECCVLATAMEAIDLGIPVVYVEDAVAGISSETEAATRLVIAGLDYVQTKIVTTEEYLK